MSPTKATHACIHDHWMSATPSCRYSDTLYRFQHLQVSLNNVDGLLIGYNTAKAFALMNGAKYFALARTDTGGERSLLPSGAWAALVVCGTVALYS